jgi:hypothetical protein
LLSPGTITLADIAARTDTLSIACTKCDRAGRYPLATLIKRYAPELSIPDLLRILSAGCPMRESVSPDALCGAYCPDLLRLFPGDGAANASGTIQLGKVGREV